MYLSHRCVLKANAVALADISPNTECWKEQSAVLYLKVLSVPLQQLITLNTFASVNYTCCATATTPKKNNKKKTTPLICDVVSSV